MLSETVKIRVRFSEVDSIKMVWHGRYVTYLEDAREAFGHKYGLEYMTMFNNGLLAPMVDMKLQYKSTATVDDELLVKITMQPARGGKIVFDYEITNARTEQLVLTASSIQLFTNMQGEFDPMPQWFQDWKKQYDLK